MALGRAGSSPAFSTKALQKCKAFFYTQNPQRASKKASKFNIFLTKYSFCKIQQIEIQIFAMFYFLTPLDFVKTRWTGRPVIFL